MEFILANDPLPAPPPPPPPPPQPPMMMTTTGADTRGGAGTQAGYMPAGYEVGGGAGKGAGAAAGGGGRYHAGVGGKQGGPPASQERLTQMTAFTDLMENAGFKKGEPFLFGGNGITSTGSSPSRGGGGGGGGGGVRR